MMRIASIIVLSAYCLVSLLGHAGVSSCTRGAFNEWASAGDVQQSVVPATHDPNCCHSHHRDHAAECCHDHAEDSLDESNSCPDGCPGGCPGGCPDDCVVCHFFSLFKAQGIAVSAPCVRSYSVSETVFWTYDILFAFDCTRLPRPRGPPSLIL